MGVFVLDYIKLLRPQQWIKNFFVMAPLFFGGRFTDTNALINVVLCFVCFCFAASGIYIINDYRDIDADKQHPHKCHRPLASGKVSPTLAFCISLVFMLSSILISLRLNGNEVIVFAGYIILNLGYSFGLKNIALLDIFIVSFGFVLRVLAGGLSAGVEVSQWLFTLTFLLALFIALGKRYDDIILKEKKDNTIRKAIAGYNDKFIQNAMVMMASVLIVTYMMYVSSPDITERYKNKYLYVSALFVVLGVLRYLQLCLVFEKSASPTKLVYRDLFLQLCIIGWVLYYFICIYWFGFKIP